MVIREARVTSRSFARRSAPAGVVVALGAMLFGCFDVKVVDVSEDDAGSAGGSGSNVPALLIDDFEDGNRVPSDLRFGPWRCNSYSTSGTPPAKCGVSPGYYSNYGYSVDFELADAKNGIPDYPGVQLGSQTVAPLDVSPYKNIVFSAKLVPRDIPLPEPVYIYINLSCHTVSPAEPSDGVFSINAAVQPASFWQSFSLPLSNFIQFEWQRAVMRIDERACAKLVDGIVFRYQIEFANGDASVDGEAVAATLTIDNVYLQ